jgi:hypothetical protein
LYINWFSGEGFFKVTKFIGNVREYSNQVWWHTSVILALGRLTQKDGKLEARLGYIARP